MSTAATAVEVLKWVPDGGAVQEYSPVGVDEALWPVLDEQLSKLDTVDAKVPGKRRYQLARQAGVLCALAKGARSRELKPNQLHVPGTELSVSERGVRISALRCTMPLPSNMHSHVKCGTFVKDD